MIKLSILIPSIPSRNEKMVALFNKINSQILWTDVEILCFVDNKKRSIGFKRDALVQMANGKYLTFIDDDDNVSDNYISLILDAIDNSNNPDVICFKIACSMNSGNIFIVDHDISYENEESRIVDGKWVDVKRKPLHNSVWKSSLAKSENFPDASYGEDSHWSKRLHPKVKSSYKIDNVLSHYRWDKDITEAELTFPKD